MHDTYRLVVPQSVFQIGLVVSIENAVPEFMEDNELFLRFG